MLLKIKLNQLIVKDFRYERTIIRMVEKLVRLGNNHINQKKLISLDSL